METPSIVFASIICLLLLASVGALGWIIGLLRVLVEQATAKEQEALTARPSKHFTSPSGAYNAALPPLLPSQPSGTPPSKNER